MRSCSRKRHPSSFLTIKKSAYLDWKYPRWFYVITVSLVGKVFSRILQGLRDISTDFMFLRTFIALPLQASLDLAVMTTESQVERCAFFAKENTSPSLAPGVNHFFNNHFRHCLFLNQFCKAPSMTIPNYCTLIFVTALGNSSITYERLACTAMLTEGDVF